MRGKFSVQPECPKCTFKGIEHKIIYESQRDYSERAIDEWLNVYCHRCGFPWEMDCADADTDSA